MENIINLWKTNILFHNFVVITGIIIGSFILNYIFKKVILKYLEIFVRKTKTKWDDIFYETGIFTILSQLAPAIFLYYMLPLLPEIEKIGKKFVSIWIVFIIIIFIHRLLNGLLRIYNTFEISKKRPLKGYVQIILIFLYIIGIILSISILIDKSPFVFLSGIGALTAIIILIFKDTILGFVASMQIIGNDLIRIGDWIEVPKYGADGEVLEIALHHVKVKNWDKTITVIPTYKLIEDSFKNWRGMEESKGRRIKRAIIIDKTSIKFCDEKMLEKFEKIQLLKNYLEKKKKEIEEYNRINNIDKKGSLVNGRQLTNIGTFRAYISEYLKHHPKIRKDMTCMVRQLPPTTDGLPLEIYAFVNDIKWINYEGIQADIFDHILAATKEFNLRLSQKPTGYDVQQLAEKLKN